MRSPPEKGRSLPRRAAARPAKLGNIDFEPGSDELAPPERQKLEAVARALKERPTLRLVVPPSYAVKEDTPVLKSLAVRSDIAARMGVKLAPGEDPGADRRRDSADPARSRRLLRSAMRPRC